MLKPCPFCGDEAYVEYVGNALLGISQAEIGCSKCKFKRIQRFIKYKFDYEFIQNTTITAWNKRVGEQDAK